MWCGPALDELLELGIGRLGQHDLEPDVLIARVVLFIAADDSSAMTNQTWMVDGGWV